MVKGIIGKKIGMTQIFDENGNVVPVTVIAHQLQCAVGNHLVGVHVRGRTGSTLDHIDREVLVVLPRHDLATSLCDGLINLIAQQAQLVVGHSCAQLNDSQTMDKARIVAQMKFADREILQTAHRLDTIQDIFRDLHRSQQITLGACVFLRHNCNFYVFKIYKFQYFSFSYVKVKIYFPYSQIFFAKNQLGE